MQNKVNDRKRWFNVYKKIIRLFIKKPKLIYLGDKIEKGSIILCNHEGLFSPVKIELYRDYPLRIWGTYEMNSGLKNVYKYLTEVFYHQKKKWNIHLARLFCIIAAPVVNLFYKWLNLISTYKDIRFKKTISTSISVLQNESNILIFPEDSDDGYFQVLNKFNDGCVLFFEYCRKHNINAPIYVAYYNKKEDKIIYDKPVTINELLDLNLTRTELAKKLCNRCNELGTM